MVIGIIGFGVVGKAVKFGFEKKEGNTVHVYDIKLQDTSLEKVVHQTDIIFVCVSTPRQADGFCDVSNIHDVCKKINALARKAKKKKDVVIKSTIDPQCIKDLGKRYKYIRLAMNPEFLKEQAAIHDVCHQDICVIGTDHDELYEKIVRAHGDLAQEYIKTTPVNAMLVKYFCNTFNATQVIFANLFYDLATALGADYREVRKIALKRYTDMKTHYLDCNSNLRGFGGACLPKDTDAIIALCKLLNIEYDILHAIVHDNKRLHTKHPNSI